jgi:hypothetical protein
VHTSLPLHTPGSESGQVVLPLHAFDAQSVWHAHDSEQSRSPEHDPDALQVMLQAPGPHVIVPVHVPVPVHATSQSVAIEQSIAPSHAPVDEHTTWQPMPAGHVIPPWHAPACEQSMMHVPSWQVSHTAGHTNASDDSPLSPPPSSPVVVATHHPPTHERSPSQSVGRSQR